MFIYESDILFFVTKDKGIRQRKLKREVLIITSSTIIWTIEILYTYRLKATMHTQYHSTRKMITLTLNSNRYNNIYKDDMDVPLPSAI